MPNEKECNTEIPFEMKYVYTCNMEYSESSSAHKNSHILIVNE